MRSSRPVAPVRRRSADAVHRPSTGRRTLLALLPLLAWPAAGARAQEPFTLEEILRAPFVSDLVAAPTGATFAWVRYEEGVRDVWVASRPGFRGRRLTSYGSDDGQEISDLSFTPDGRRLLFVRGGAPNRDGEIPNPISDPRGSERKIWVVDLEGPEAGTPREVAEGDAPVPSPDGSRVVFVREGRLWWAPLDATADSSGGSDDGARALATVRGRISSVRWSPDGRWLAFVSARGDHGFIGILEPEEGTLRFIDPSVDRDGSPAWSPDGRRLAFLRIPNERDRLPFAPRRAALPWSLRVADVETGASVEVWRAPQGAGSAFQSVESSSQLWWGAGDRLVFPWEGDGWLHLYSVPAGGGEATPLTPGEFEVEHVTLAADRRHVVFSSNQDDIDRRHLWRVAVGGGAASEALTSGEGIEWSPVVAADGRSIAFLASDARTPAHAEVLETGGTRRPLVEAFLPAGFPLAELVVPEPVVLEAEDGVRVHAQLFTPPDLAAGDRRPALLFFHGGSRRQMLLGFHYLGYYHNAYALNQYLASRGYIVLSVNYRSGTGYGLEFREALDYGARGASEYRDVVAAGRWLAERPDVDPARIGLWGG
ncbi:MAG: DPP IV N-terminal domain-containing protein, partial [Gemmatimonadota bacterium]